MSCSRGVYAEYLREYRFMRAFAVLLAVGLEDAILFTTSRRTYRRRPYATVSPAQF